MMLLWETVEARELWVFEVDNVYDYIGIINSITTLELCIGEMNYKLGIEKEQKIYDSIKKDLFYIENNEAFDMIHARINLI